MPVPPRLLLPLAALLPLGACGGSTADQFPPPCPTASIPRDFNDIHRYRGSGRDLTDSVLDGRITDLNGTCKADGPGTVVVTVTPGIELSRGPAAPGRVAAVSYFVAVSEGDTILDKQVYPLRAEFPANTDRVRLTGDEVELRLPVTASKPASVYRVSVGFQLTSTEVEINRRRIPGR